MSTGFSSLASGFGFQDLAVVAIYTMLCYILFYYIILITILYYTILYKPLNYTILDYTISVYPLLSRQLAPNPRPDSEGIPQQKSEHRWT